ncbi:hypothetical protein [Streptomyces sp. NPDC047097]|uniref:hypothetical protein n=1 Tax=Streptomyces sp. NPDC047097 TaxID=3155260 RepID=UPI0033ECF1DF
MPTLTHGRCARTSMAALSVAGLALFGVSGSAEAAPVPFRIEVTFESIAFPRLDDCDLYSCPWAEMYGSLYGQTVKGGQTLSSTVRNIGQWGNDCQNTGWQDNKRPTCPVWVKEDGQGAGGTYKFADRLMCTAQSYKACTGAYRKANHRAVLSVNPGESIKVAVHAKDLDTGSSDDDICFASKTIGSLDAVKLASLDVHDEFGQGFNGDGACRLRFHLKTVGPA